MTVMIRSVGQLRPGLEPSLPGGMWYRPIGPTLGPSAGAPLPPKNGDAPPLPDGPDGSGTPTPDIPDVTLAEEGWFTAADGSIKWTPVIVGAAVLAGIYYFVTRG